MAIIQRYRTLNIRSTRAGSYSITLNASNIAGYNSTTKVDYIIVIPQSPVASFTSNVTEGLAPLEYPVQ